MIRALRHSKRLVHIICTLARYDVWPIDVVPLPRAYAWLYRLMVKKRDGRVGQRLAQALTELGPSFIKLGQMLSTRADLISDPIAADLAFLQDRLPPFPASAAIEIVEKELGQPLNKLFKTFEPSAIAAASIAQVHKATLPNGQAVAVKILRPDVAQQFDRDLSLGLWLAEWLERVDEQAAQKLKPVAVMRTFRRVIDTEMNLSFEAAAASELKQNFAGDDDFVVPNVHWSHTTKQVLTLDWIEGVRIDDHAALKKAKLNRSDVLARASRTFFKQVFEHGFFHADMHPGNIFVLPTGQLAPVDFGIMGRVSWRDRLFLADMLAAFLNRDYARVADVHFEAGLVPAHQSRDALTLACRAIGEPLLEKPLHLVSIGKLLAQLFELADEFEMTVQPELLLLQKTIVMAEGIGRSLDDRVNMWQVIRPSIEQWMRQHRGFEAQAKRRLHKLFHVLDELPTTLKKLAEPAAISSSHPPIVASRSQWLHTSLAVALGMLLASTIILGPESLLDHLIISGHNIITTISHWFN